MALFLATPGHAASLSYEFTGNISEIYADPFKRAESLQLRVGVPVSYSFLVDFQKEGVGSKQPVAGRLPQPAFFSELLGASFLQAGLGVSTSTFGWPFEVPPNPWTGSAQPLQK